jgi:hypothetical protein
MSDAALKEKTGKQLKPEDVQDFHAQVESLSREAQERLKKARDTITQLSA